MSSQLFRHFVLVQGRLFREPPDVAEYPALREELDGGGDDESEDMKKTMIRRI